MNASTEHRVAAKRDFDNGPAATGAVVIYPSARGLTIHSCSVKARLLPLRGAPQTAFAWMDNQPSQPWAELAHSPPVLMPALAAGVSACRNTGANEVRPACVADESNEAVEGIGGPNLVQPSSETVGAGLISRPLLALRRL